MTEHILIIEDEKELIPKLRYIFRIGQNGN